jgi:hypothetical protein
LCIGLFVRQMEIGFQVFLNAPQNLFRFQALFDRLALLQRALRLLLVLPEVGGRCFALEFAEAGAVLGGVKESSARAPSAC